MKNAIYQTAIAFLFISLVFSPEVRGANIEKRVVFPKGKTSVSYTAKLPRSDYDSYVLRARKKQTLSVNLTTPDPDARIRIYETREFGPEDDTIYDGANGLNWSGTLPITSEYSIQVYGSENPASSRPSYRLEISLR